MFAILYLERKTKMQRFEYLIYSLVFLATLGLVLFFRKDLKPHILIPCLIGAIVGPASELLYFNDYWRPYTIFGQAKPGIEDMIFGAAAIGISLAVYAFIFKKSEWQRHHKRHTKVALAYLLVGCVTLFFLNSNLHINSVIATAITCSLLLVPILIARPDLLKPTLVTGLTMALLAGLVYYILLGYIFKNALPGVWLLNNTRLGVKIFRYIPLTELLWFFTVGGFLEAFDMYLRDAHFRNKRLAHKAKISTLQRRKVVGSSPLR